MKINFNKYTDIAVQSPRGKVLNALIDQNWYQWQCKVQNAPKFNSYKIEQQRGYKARANDSIEILAQQIFSRYVWGISMEKWTIKEIVTFENGADFFLLDGWLESLCFTKLAEIL